MSRNKLAIGDHDVRCSEIKLCTNASTSTCYRRATGPPFCGIHLLLRSVALPRSFDFIHRIASHRRD